MKKLFFLLSTLGVIALSSCNDDHSYCRCDNGQNFTTEEITEDFKEQCDDFQDQQNLLIDYVPGQQGTGGVQPGPNPNPNPNPDDPNDPNDPNNPGTGPDAEPRKFVLCKVK